MTKFYKKTLDRDYSTLATLTDKEFAKENGLHPSSVRALRRKFAPKTSNSAILRSRLPTDYKPLSYHGLTCIRKCKEGKDGFECDIYKLANCLRHRIYERGIKLKASQLSSFANLYIENYKNDTSLKKVEFFRFIDSKILELLDPKIKETLKFEPDGRISRIFKEENDDEYIFNDFIEIVKQHAM